MKNTKITIKNYRGFSDADPAVFEIGGGFTAFLGRNNAGKSSAKLLFYELRPLFAMLTQTNPQTSPGFFYMMGGGHFAVNSYAGVADPLELFNNKSGRPITLEIEAIGAKPIAPSAPSDCVTKIILSAELSSPLRWRMEAYGAQGAKLHSPNGYKFAAQHVAISGDGRARIEVTDIAETLEALTKSKYYSAFRNPINVGAGDHFDLKVGTAFIDLWNHWKTSGIKAQTRAIGQVTEDIRRLFDFGQLEINASLALKTLMVVVDQHSYRLPELGSGIAQFIMVLGNAATTQPSIVFIDEPETNLHPSLQIDFLLALAQYASVGCVFSTHSVGLARSVAQRIYSFRRGRHGSFVRPFEATPNYVEFLGELSFSAFKEMGHDRLLLVEGVNDVKVAQQLLRLVMKEHTTVILPLGGNQLVTGGREAELHELRRLSSNVFALVDSERSAVGADADPRRTAFAETCNSLGIQLCVTERRAIENYFPDEAVKAAFGNSFSALAPYQELRTATNGWNKIDNWKIVRQMTLGDLMGTDLGAFIERI